MRLPGGIALLVLFAALPAYAAPELQPSGEVADVVVVGAGPAGLFAAIQARLQGAEHVVVLERRGEVRVREQTLTLVDDVAARLAESGVDLTGLGHIADQAEYITRAGLTFRIPLFRGIAGTHRWLSRGGTLRSVMSNGLGFERTTIATNVLEGALLARARQLGIRVHYDVPVTDVHEDADAVRVTIDRPGSQPLEVRGRWLAVADGAHSPTRARLGVDVETVAGDDRMLWAVYDQPGNATLVKRAVPGWGSLGRIRMITIPSRDTTAVGIDLPKEVELSPADLAALADEAAQKLGVKGRLVQPPSEFRAVLTRAQRVVVGKRIFLLGDAAHTSTPFAGMGINAALDDGLRFGDLYRSLRAARSERHADRARDWFRIKSRVGTSLMHGFSRLQLQGRPKTRR